MKKMLLCICMLLMASLCFGCSGKNKSEDKKDASDLSSMVADAVSEVSEVGKYVEESRNNADASNYDTLVVSAQIALTDLELYEKILSEKHTYTITVKADGVEIACDGAVVDEEDNVYKSFAESLGSGFADSMKKKSKTAEDYVITIDSTGAVLKTVSP